MKKTPTPDRLGYKVKYVVENPVKAGLVKSWKEWRWNYLRESPAKPDAN